MPSAASAASAKPFLPMAGMADWEITLALSNALGYPMHYSHPSEIMDEIARLTPTFAGVSFDKIDEMGSIQWPCNDKAPEGTPVMHIGGFVRGKGRFMITEFIPTDERTTGRFPLILTTGRILTQYNVGAQTAAPKTTCGTPRTFSKFIPSTPRIAASAKAIACRSPAAPAKPRCGRTFPSACSPAWFTLPSITASPAQTWSPPSLKTGPPAAPNTK